MITQEDMQILLELIKKVSEEGLLNIYDSQENHYEVDWIFLDTQLCIKIKET